MPILEDAERAVEAVTGWARPDRQALHAVASRRKPHLFRFKDDGETPNHPKWPLVLYRSPVALRKGVDPAAVLEDLFAANGWKDSWRDGVYDFLHFHTHAHEVLGIARGRVRIQFGGARGRRLDLKAGDVVVLPAGTGHRRIDASRDLLVVGAYPGSSGRYDQPGPKDVDHARAVRAVSRVPAPKADPVYGRTGPLVEQWR